jgi:hypothetical protein
LLNMSMRADPGVHQPEVVRAALAYAYANDVVLLAAIGNQSMDHDTALSYPADADDRFVVCVSGSKIDGQKHDQSDFGSSVDFAAPYLVYAYAGSHGSSIYTYNVIPGTSGATPLVTGGYALLRAYQLKRYNGAMASDPQFLPLNVPHYLAPEDYQNIFALSAHNKYDQYSQYQPVRNKYTGYGVIDIGAALTYIMPPFSLEHLELQGELSVDQMPMDTLYIAMPRYYTHPGPGLDSLWNDDLYEVIPYRVHGFLNYPKSFPGTIRAWARGARSVGLEYPRPWTPVGQTLSKRYPLYLNANWSNVLSWTDTRIEVETYIYKRRLFGTLDQFEYIHGYEPANVKFAISLIHGAPVAVRPLHETGFTITGPFPSPATSTAKLYLTLEAYASVTVELHDIFGRRLATIIPSTTMTAGTHHVTVTTRDLVSGVYFMRFVVDNIPTTRKIMVFR